MTHVVGDEVSIVVGVLRSVNDSKLELVLDIAVLLIETELGDNISKSEIKGGDKKFTWPFLSSLAEATDVKEVSWIVQFETSAVHILEDVEVVEMVLGEEFTISVDDLDDDFVVIINEYNNVIRDPSSLGKSGDSVC